MKLDWQTAGDPAARAATLADNLDGLFSGAPAPAPLPGGRSAALERLESVDPTGYGERRNYLDGPVTRLSAYLRHGMVTPSEVRDSLRRRFGDDPRRFEELLRQLAWRDFFGKVLEHHGAALLRDVEPPKHDVRRCEELPTDIAEGRTGLPCVDAWLGRLFREGYMHNHERLWFAAYFCHFRGLRWTEGARLFRQYLLDGDLASNNASWQWVESTFAAKPYFMNQENVAKFSGNRWCATCTADCPFRASYPELQERLFLRGRAPLAPPGGEA